MSCLPGMKRIYPPDRVLFAVEDNVANSLRQLLGALDASRLYIGNVSLGVDPREIEHGLREAPVGYYVVRRDGPAVVYDLAAKNPQRHLRLAASAPVKVALMVF